MCVSIEEFNNTRESSPGQHNLSITIVFITSRIRGFLNNNNDYCDYRLRGGELRIAKENINNIDLNCSSVSIRKTEINDTESVWKFNIDGSSSNTAWSGNCDVTNTEKQGVLSAMVQVCGHKDLNFSPYGTEISPDAAKAMEYLVFKRLVQQQILRKQPKNDNKSRYDFNRPPTELMISP